MPVQIRYCDLGKQSLADHPESKESVKKFISSKFQDPLAPYGGSDTHFVGSGPFGGLKLKHAHVTQDLSIVYRIHGKPTLLDIYGLFTHKDLGTGNAPNIKTQKNMAKKFSSQTFNENNQTQV